MYLKEVATARQARGLNDARRAPGEELLGEVVHSIRHAATDGMPCRGQSRSTKTTTSDALQLLASSASLYSSTVSAGNAVPSPF